MNNINWGKNSDWNTENHKTANTVSIQENNKLSIEEIKNLKEELLIKYIELLELSTKFYTSYSSKELHDSIITLKSAKKSLINVNI